LRERPSEIPPLARALVRRLTRRAGGEDVPEIDNEAIAALTAHAWPGNVRELRNVLERALVLRTAGPITLEQLPLARLNPAASAPPLVTDAPPRPAPAPPTEVPPPGGAADLWASVEGLERERILKALADCGGNQTRAAKMLGVSRRMLVQRLEAYGVPRPRKRPEG
jgi:DNA-binding NtrC family response regulator